MRCRRPVQHTFQELGLEEWGVYRNHQIQVGLSGREGGMNAGKRARIGKNVFDRLRTEAGAIADDEDASTNSGCKGPRSLQQSLSAELEKGFVFTHAGTLAAGKDESGSFLSLIGHSEHSRMRQEKLSLYFVPVEFHDRLTSAWESAANFISPGCCCS